MDEKTSPLIVALEFADRKRSAKDIRNEQRLVLQGRKVTGHRREARAILSKSVGVSFCINIKFGKVSGKRRWELCLDSCEYGGGALSAASRRSTTHDMPTLFTLPLSKLTWVLTNKEK